AAARIQPEVSVVEGNELSAELLERGAGIAWRERRGIAAGDHVARDGRAWERSFYRLVVHAVPAREETVVAVNRQVVREHESVNAALVDEHQSVRFAQDDRVAVHDDVARSVGQLEKV